MYYKVKLKREHNANIHQYTNTGYLGVDKSEFIYSRGEAIKKAKMFGGNIEVVPISKVFNVVSMTQIPENALLDRIVNELVGRECFTDTDKSLDERIYNGDVFEAILNEFDKKGKNHPFYPQEKVIKQLDDLAQMIQTDYVQITKI